MTNQSDKPDEGNKGQTLRDKLADLLRSEESRTQDAQQKEDFNARLETIEKGLVSLLERQTGEPEGQQAKNEPGKGNGVDPTSEPKGTPGRGVSQQGPANGAGGGISKEDLLAHKVSPEQINENWEEISKRLRAGTL